MAIRRSVVNTSTSVVRSLNSQLLATHVLVWGIDFSTVANEDNESYTDLRHLSSQEVRSAIVSGCEENNCGVWGT
jgi:hypothetical protein